MGMISNTIVAGLPKVIAENCMGTAAAVAIYGWRIVRLEVSGSLVN
jgi:hypothetical protein